MTAPPPPNPLPPPPLLVIVCQPGNKDVVRQGHLVVIKGTEHFPHLFLSHSCSLSRVLRKGVFLRGGGIDSRSDILSVRHKTGAVSLTRSFSISLFFSSFSSFFSPLSLYLYLSLFVSLSLLCTH